MIWDKPTQVLAFGFGAGLAPRAPGTFGTLVAIPLYLALAPLPMAVYLAITALLFGFGVWLCGRVARDLGVHDHGGIVWDEIVGLLITMAAGYAGFASLAAGFILFRLFDIWKPWPIGWLDRQVHGGFGIMLDDAVAGLYAALLLGLLHHYGLP
jgi:phosphatidylglycerophosphatase A